MIIRAVSVFESVVYHSYAVDPSKPCRPVLEVEAVVREGDVDAGPLLVSVAEWAAMAGGPDLVRPCLARFRQAGRLVDHQGVVYLSFPFWTPVELEHR